MIPIKSEKEIQLMRQAGKELARILNLVVKKVKVGVGTKELDELAEKEIRKIGGFPIFKGYQGFPTVLCTCINEEVVHASAIPDRKLKDGDIFSIDIGIRLPSKNGMIADMATTVAVGKISKQAEKLMDVTKKSLELAIQKIKPDIYLGDISYAIQSYVEKNGFNVVRDLVGHGVGKKLHEDPQVPNYGLVKTGPILKSGMTLAIEPMVTAGKWQLEFKKENQAYMTVDKSLVAHFEHTVLITDKGAEILTK
ncbi:MAG: type I methionyl aminopeptidase [Patescibacteria group bacterium]